MTRRLTWLLLVGAVACGWHHKPFPEPLGEGEIGRSNLTIPAGQTFELGGGHEGGLRVRVANVGRAEVDVIDAVGEAVRVSRGETVDAIYGPGKKASLRNLSDREARLKVVFTKDTEQHVGMRYVEDTPAP